MFINNYYDITTHICTYVCIIINYVYVHIYRIAQNIGGVKLWRIDHFRVLAGGNADEFTIANIATLVNLEFGGVKYWQMVFGSPN